MREYILGYWREINDEPVCFYAQVIAHTEEEAIKMVKEKTSSKGFHIESVKTADPRKVKGVVQFNQILL